MAKVVIYIPVYNNAEWCRSFIPHPGFDYIVSDNQSTDGSADILAAKGLTVIRQTQNLGRIGNWDFCFRHFLKSDWQWVKLHMAGDELFPEASEIIERLIARYPAVRFIATSCEIVRSHKRNCWFGPAKREEVVSSVEAVRRVALKGNWLGIMLTTFIHREALAGEFVFGELPWIADLRFYLWILERFPVLCSPETVGQLVVHPNRLHAKFEHTFRARCEEGIVRSEAAEILRKLEDYDDAEYADFLNQTQRSWETFVFEKMRLPRSEGFQIEFAANCTPIVLVKAAKKKLFKQVTKFSRRR